MKLIITMMLFISFGLSAAQANTCDAKTGDAGRWRDPLKPSDKIDEMCHDNVSEFQAQQGRMVITNKNPADCDAAVAYARTAESWHGDWFLWSRIGCTGGMFVFIR